MSDAIADEMKEDTQRVSGLTKKKKEVIKILTGSSCKYTVVREAAENLGWKLVNEEASDKVKKTCNIIWVDTSNVNDYFTTIRPWQCINHFPGMTNIARKSRLADNLGVMKKRFRKHYSFFPSTYILPRDKTLLERKFQPSGKSKYTFIVKPDGGCQGKGIFLTKDYSVIEELRSPHVAQRYIMDPLLIERKKFDLRIYVLITSCQPLRIYLFRDGLVRMCTEDFAKPNGNNLEDRCMHLTNYAINKKSENFEGIDKEEGGSKRSIKWFFSWLAEQKGLDAVESVWSKIGQICVKTIISIAPTLVREYETVFGVSGNADPSDLSKTDEYMQSKSIQHDSHTRIKIKNMTCVSPTSKIRRKSYQEQTKHDKDLKKVIGSRCISILGFDIMIDAHLKPHLIEVNHLPSFGTDSQLDESIKSKVVYQALSVFKASASDQCAHEADEKSRRDIRLYGKVNESNKARPISETSVQDKKVRAERDEDALLSASEDSDVASYVEENVTQIYATYAPEKVNKVKVLLRKYKGYEEWLLQKLREKYCPPLPNCDNDHTRVLHNSNVESAKGEYTEWHLPDNNEAQDIQLMETNSIDQDVHSGDESSVECENEGNVREKYDLADPDLVEEEKLLEESGDYDRIYPPKDNGLHTPPYLEMRKYAFEESMKQQMRLICPLSQIHKSDKNDQCPTTLPIALQSGKGFLGNLQCSRSGWMVNGNVHVRGKEMPTKNIHPPTQKQIDAADRLCRGFSSEYASSVYNESNASMEKKQIINRLSRAEQEGKEIRKRNEEKFTLKSQLAMKPINIEFSQNLFIQGCESGERCYVDFTGQKVGSGW